MCVLPSKRPSPLGSSAIVVAYRQIHLLRIARRRDQAEMAIGQAGQQASPRCALHEALLQQEWLDDFFQGVAGFAECRGDGLDADRPPAETLGQKFEIT